MKKIIALASAGLLVLAVAAPVAADKGGVPNENACLGLLRSTQSGEEIGSYLGNRDPNPNGGPWTQYGAALQAWKDANCP